MSASLRWLAAPLLVVLVSGTAVAQRGRAEDEYDEAIRDALVEWDAGRWAEARALFQRAHELQPNARTLRGIGMSAFEMRQYVEAIRFLTASLTEPERPLTERQRSQVEELLARARAFLGHYRLIPSVASAQIVVDDMPIDDIGDLWLDLGSHTIVARAVGYEPLHRRLEVRGGEDEVLQLELMPLRVGGDAPRDFTTVAVALLVVGGTAAAATIGSAIYLDDRSSELGRCDAEGVFCGNRETLASELDGSIGLTSTFAVVSVAAFVTAAVLLAESGDADGGGDQASACRVDGIGMRCTWGL